MINDIDEINVVIQDNDSISVNEGSVTDISEIVHNEEIRQANEAQRVINENERILNEGSREDYIADLKQQVEDGDFDGTDGISPVVTMEKQGKVTTLTITDATGTHTTEIRDGNDGSGTGDMLKATYDTNDNGVVDNAEKVNNHTVNSDVPANAVFTDTTYTAGTGIDITNGVISNTQTSAEWGNITGDIDDQLDLQSALGDKADASSLSTVATSGDYDDLLNKPTIPSAVSDLNNDLGFIDNTVNDLTNYTLSSSLSSVATSGSYSDLSNTPNLATVATSGSYTDLSNTPTIPTIDNAVSTSSTNGVENQAITNYVDDQVQDAKDYIDEKTTPISYTLTETPAHSGGTNLIYISKIENIVVMNFNIWTNSITANAWTNIGKLPNDIIPSNSNFYGVGILNNGATGNFVGFCKLEIYEGYIRIKASAGNSGLTGVQANITYVL